MLCNWHWPRTLFEKSKWKRSFNELGMKKGDPVKFFARVDKIVVFIVCLILHSAISFGIL